MILIIDNYDSFVYNLSRYVEELGYKTIVIRNDKISVHEVRKLNPDKIIISPGPCTPNEAGITLDLIKSLYMAIPILGVCLGHQAIAQVFGCKIIRANSPCHGKSSEVTVKNDSIIFKNLPQKIKVGRYHSLISTTPSNDSELEVTATIEDGSVMALSHKVHDVHSLQFHPESILTEYGYDMISNFLRI